jgi:probable rRNA maturation factor
MNVKIDLENSCPGCWVPSVGAMEKWLQAAGDCLAAGKSRVSLSVRVVDRAEAAELNGRYRGKDQPTNVLSFGSQLPASVLKSLETLPLGDLAICAPLVDEEAGQQGKSVEAHWAHLLTHGFLHLHGYRHDRADAAEQMESLESAIMAALGFPNPYQQTDQAG